MTDRPTMPDVFVAAPLGRYVVGPTYLIWCEAADLQGAILWGEIDESTIREIIGISRFVAHPHIAARRRVLVDCGGVTRADADALLGLTAFARDRVARWSHEIERQALIVPPGLVGIFVAGVLPAAGVAHPLRVSTDLETALAFMACPAVAAAHAAAVRATEAARGTSTLLFRLRLLLARTELARPSASTTAAALGMSTRTLYRELRRLGTTFVDEVRRARMFSPRREIAA